MLYKKFQMLTQIVGCVTIALLAIYGLLMVLSGDSPVWAAIGQAATLASQEVPSTFNYQGFLREPDGSLTTGSYTITARIYDVATEGTALYTTTLPNVTVRDGLFNIVLGDDPPMTAEAFADVPRYIGITLDSLKPEDELIPPQVHGRLVRPGPEEPGQAVGDRAVTVVDEPRPALPHGDGDEE